MAMYDWHPEKRGTLLLPKGSDSIEQGVTILAGSSALEILYKQGRLEGQAFIDAQGIYKTIPSKRRK